MPATSIENYVEQIFVLQLGGQADLSGVAIKRHDEDTEAAKDRVTVKAEPREIAVEKPAGGAPVVWRVPVVVTAHLVTRSAATMDAYIAAIQAAFATGTAGVAAAVTLATAQFPNGFKVEETDDGDRENADETRRRSKRFDVLIVI